MRTVWRRAEYSLVALVRSPPGTVRMMRETGLEGTEAADAEPELEMAVMWSFNGADFPAVMRAGALYCRCLTLGPRAERGLSDSGHSSYRQVPTSA